jgi:bifunctional UDP-N-acetylglucosamine pyrophosphorylase/glucosamine-1-phosphate N-acetyltransferase
MQVEPFLNGSDGPLVILAGDCPLIELETLQNLVSMHKESNADASILSTEMAEPGSYGRILRGKMGTVVGIKEAKDCTPDEYEITEINTGIYVFQRSALSDALKLITTNNNQQEYYLTDVIHILKEKGAVVEAYCTEDSDQAIGINTRMDLAKINQIIYQKNNVRFMQEGVTIIDPSNTFIDSTVSIGQDTIIFPFSVITGKTNIGCGVKIGPHVYIKDSVISQGTEIDPFSKLIAHHKDA